MYTTIAYSLDAAGVATLVLDLPGRAANILTSQLLAELQAAVSASVADGAVKGLIITSAKSSFVAGADMKEMIAAFENGLDVDGCYALSQRLSQLFRYLETCGKPIVAAINGSALGSGLELALACHRRVLVDDARVVIGLPEVKLGLLAAAGGTQRVVRLMGIAKAAKLLTEGTPLTPAAALQAGLVHELAPPDELLQRARHWLLDSPEAVAPWDRKGFKVPGGTSLADPGVAQALMIGTALASRVTMRNVAAPRAILSALYEGAVVPISTGLRIESKYLALLMAEAEPRNMMRTVFLNKGNLDSLSRRPATPPACEVRRLGIIGAGMMGSAIAYVAAEAGIEVVILDRELQYAEQAKRYAQGQLEKAVQRGRYAQGDATAILDRITPGEDYSGLSACDLIIEAVTEDAALKARVTRLAEEAMSESAIVASNTSTLPITSLARASRRPAQFIGMHFFSPVEKMALVEVIVGRATSQDTLARALDLARQLRKTPIVVNDARGFFTSRVFSTYCHEGIALLAEGVAPALIENAARMAGMSVGPLAVSDEVSLSLHHEIDRQARAQDGDAYRPPAGAAVIARFVESLRRVGRKGGAGFYEYPVNGQKFLWPGLLELYPPRSRQPEAAEVSRRLLHIQALEAARCFEDGVVTTAEEADVGSILGIGFPAWTGGVLSYIDTLGPQRFVAQSREFAARYGERFEPPRDLLERARDQRYYQPRLLRAASCRVPI